MGSKEQLAKIFLEAREKIGLTQLEVAKKAKISVNYYARVERGEAKPRWDIVDQIAKALDIKLKLPLES